MPNTEPGGCAPAEFPPSALSCTTASDCVMVPACQTTPSCSSTANGACCMGECYCDGLAVNVSAAPPLAANGSCPAAGCECGSGVAECFQGQCIMTTTCQSSEDCDGAQCCAALGSTPCPGGDAGMCGFCVPAGECGDAG